MGSSQQTKGQTLLMPSTGKTRTFDHYKKSMHGSMNLIIYFEYTKTTVQEDHRRYGSDRCKDDDDTKKHQRPFLMRLFSPVFIKVPINNWLLY